MKNIYTLMILLVMAGMASAAVYSATNPVATLAFTREEPGPAQGDPTVETLIECGAGYASNCDMGEMTTNVLDRRVMHKNTAETTYNGIVCFNITNSEGLYLAQNGAIGDFNTITFTDPSGNTCQCNNGDCIERIDTNTITITPTMDVFSFEYDVTEFTNINIEFVDNAYGEYVMTAWVGTVQSI